MALRRSLLGDHEAFQVLTIDHTAVYLEFGESVFNFLCGKFITEGHEGMPEHLGVNFAVHLESLERLEDDLVIVGSTGHFVGEKENHFGEVYGGGGLIEHSLGFSAADGFADIGESLDEIISFEDTVLVDIHDAESLLELLDSRLAEEVEDVLLLTHVAVLYSGIRNEDGTDQLH